jgi:hypothetical protein
LAPVPASEVNANDLGAFELIPKNVSHQVNSRRATDATCDGAAIPRPPELEEGGPSGKQHNVRGDNDKLFVGN